MYEFWFETGLRPGELIALAWPKIDWVHEPARVRIDANVVEYVEKGPKTEAGVRDVELTPLALAALERQRARTFLAGGRVWHSPKTGKPWESDQQLRGTSYLYAMKRAGVRWRNMYQVRHTYASTLLSAGRNLFWVAEQMGHKTVEVLIRHYGRWIDQAKKQAQNDADGRVTVTRRAAS